MRMVELGNTGVVVSRLAFGTGTNGWAGQSNQTRLGSGALARLLRLGCELGVTFWDLADEYGSHAQARAALADLPRERVVIATKTTARTAADAERDVERIRREIGVDRIDVLLLHCMMSRDWPARHAGAMESLARLKERGVVRALGVSCHDLGALEATVDSPWVDVVLARTNPTGASMDASPTRVEPVLRRIRAAGKGLYGMKILGKGSLAGSRPEASRAIAHALGLRCLDAFTIGIESERQLRECVELVDELDVAE